MRKNLFIILVLYFGVAAAFSESTKSGSNPNWSRGVTYTKRDGISEYLWAPRGVIVGGEMGFYCYDGVLESIFDYDTFATAMLSRMFNITVGIASRNFEKYPDTFAVRLASHPFGFFSFWFDYRSRIYPKYHTATHNFVNMLDFYVDRTKWVDFHILFGGALTWKDTDTRTEGTTYKQDWFFFMNFMYQFRLFVHPVRFFSFGTMFGNYSDYEINTLDYWQCDTVLEFYPTQNRRLALTVKFSVINNGGMHFAGYIDRLMLSFGGRYEIKI
ncbi:MAG: hypothetical protein II707_10825 [Spirochaetales bacterium]|nr:hypothetical protein [Spirochaetales bacterium]